MRTYLRTLFNDIFKNNIIIKVFAKIVNFYCNISFSTPNTIKFKAKMPITDMEKKQIIFQSVTGDKIDCK